MIFVNKAKTLAKKIRDEYKEVETSEAHYNDETPNANSFQKQRLAVVDGKIHKIKGQEIAHDYLPDTNQ